MASERPVLYVELPQDEKGKLKELASREGLKLSQYVRQVLRKHLRKMQRKQEQ